MEEGKMLDAIEQAPLGDTRLNQRLEWMVMKLSARPGTSIPHACGSAHESKSAYRFLG